MADADKLWFELGVRDEISKVLDELMRKSDKLANTIENNLRTAFSAAGLAIDDKKIEAVIQNFYRNVLDIANVFDKIHVTQRRINDAMNETGNRAAKKSFGVMLKELKDLEKRYNDLTLDPGSLTEAGKVQALKIKDAIELLIKDSLRYVDTVEVQDRAQAKNAANEMRRVDELKSKYYELQNYRKRLSDAIVGAAPGSDLTSATSLINSISARMSAVKRAERNGSGMPASASGADYEEFLRRVKAELNGLTSATSDYNSRLEANKQLQSALNKLSADATSQQKIAGIRKQTVEYAALGRKIQEIQALIHNVSYENGLLMSGRITTPTWTKEKVTEELNAIQRRYNESLAAGRQRELDDAAAKNQRANAARKAADAVSMLAHVNEGLISSYNRIAEAGNKANRISIQIQNQIGTYAGLYGLERILKSVITIGGQFEFQHVALQNILGDIEQANTLYMQLQDLAIESPKTFMELTSYTKSLSAYQIPYKELFDTTKRLADISTGLGVDMQRLILAYGQVRSAAVLRGQELRQFTEAGIPMVQKLAEKFSELNGRMVTTGEVFELISKRAVPFEMMKEVLWDMTDEGGQFFDMQSHLADTLYGKYQKLQDSWQIMLGRIADGEGLMGSGLKNILELIVGIVSVADTLMPMLSGAAVAKLGKYTISGVGASIDKASGNTAIKNMELAKLKEANRLERERVWYGRKLEQAELDLIRNKNKLVSSDYAILAAENQISERKAFQLMQDKLLEKSDFFRLLQLKGYTRQQRVAIANTMRHNAELAKGMLQGGQSVWSKWGKGALDLVGGWWGVAFATIGGIYSLYERAGQQAERAGQLAETASSSILGSLSNVNNLYNTLSKERPKTTDDIAASIERMTNALKNSGNYSSELDKQVAATDSLTEKYRILFGELEKVSNEYLVMRDNVKAYIEAANRSGEGNWFTQLFNDNMAEDLADWSKANIAKNVAKKGVDRLGATIKTELKAFYEDLGKWNDKEMADLDWNTLFERLSEADRNKFKVRLGRKAGAFGISDEDEEYWENAEKAVKRYIYAINELGGKEAEVDSQMREYANHIQTALEESLKKQGLDPRYIDIWDNEGLTKFRDSVNDVLNSYELDGETKERFRDKLYSQLLSEPMVIKIKALPSVKKQDLAPWQQDLKNYFDNNKIRITVDAQSSLDKVEKDLQNKHKEMQESMERNGKILIKFGFDLSSLPKDIENGLAPLAPEWRSYVSKVLQDYNNDKAEDAKIVQAGKDLGLNIDAKKNKGGGNKADAQLKRWKEEWSELKAFYSEFKKWAKEIGDDAALRKLRESGLWSQLFGADGKAKYDMTDWGKAIDEFKKRNGVNGSTTDRKKFVFELGKAKVDVEFDINKKVLERELSELQEYLSMQSERWNLFKSLFEKTGNRDFASLAFGDGQMWNDLSREFADELETMMTAAGKPLPTGVWSMTDAAAKEYFKEVSGGYETWKKTVDLIRGEYKENLNAIADAYSKVATEETKVASAEARLAEARKRYGNDSAQAILAEKALNTVRAEAFEKSDTYTRFYSALFTMTISEAERAGEAIKKNLAKQLSEGTINADKYLKSIKNIDAQLDKMRNKKSGYELFKSGGFAGAAEQNVAIAEDAVSAAAERAERAEQAVLEARLKAANAVTDAEREAARLAILRARVEKTLSEEELQQAESQLKSAKQGLQLSTKANNTMNTISMVLGTWANMYKDFVSYAAEMGEDVEIAEGWDGMFGMFGSISNGINKFMSGDIGGGLMETVFGSALSFSKAHDKRMARDQKRSEEIVANLLAAMEIIEKSFERTLGSIYEYRATAEDLAELYHYIGRETPEEEARPTFGWGYKSKVRSDDTRAAIESALASGSYFDTELASLYVQRDELIRQMEDEQDKKDSDDDKIRDYKSQIAEIKDQIENFAEDMAKELWDIDVREWATQLGDALFEAWQQGESGAEAFKKKSSEIIAGLAKNIATQKLIEVAMKPVLDAVVSEMERTDGLLDTTSTERIAAALATVGETLPTAFNTLMDGIEAGVQRSGLGSIKDTDGSLSGSSLIHGSFTENEISLLMAYMNGMRGDLSIQRSEVTAIRTLLQGQAGMPALAQAQLQQLQTIAANTGRNAGLVQDIYDLLRRLSPDGQRWKV